MPRCDIADHMVGLVLGFKRASILTQVVTGSHSHLWGIKSYRSHSELHDPLWGDGPQCRKQQSSGALKQDVTR